VLLLKLALLHVVNCHLLEQVDMPSAICTVLSAMINSLQQSSMQARLLSLDLCT
jgi:hypothetical protein